MLTDFRLALRNLRRSPGYLVAAVLTLALGMAVNTTVFSIVSAMLLRPLPFADPERLVAVRLVRTATGTVHDRLSLSDVSDLKAGNRTLDGLASYGIRTVSLTDRELPEGVDAAVVTPDYFDVIGLRAHIGRAFEATDMAGGGRVVVLGEELWRRRFDGDPAIVGRAITMDGAPYTVVGVMAAEAALTNDVEQLWLPVDAPVPGAVRGELAWRVIGRLRPGVSVAQASADIRAIGDRLAERHPEAGAGWTMRVDRLRDALLPPSIRTSLGVMLGAVAFVLLIACANVANLTLARAMDRTREVAIRTALGGGRLRVTRQLLLESTIVALLGGAAGALLAVWGLRGTLAAFPFQFPPWLTPSIDVRVLVYTFMAAALSGIVFGLVPAIRAGRVDPQAALRDGGHGGTASAGRGRLRDLLVGVQLALSLVLICGAALMMKSFFSLQQADPGFRTTGILSVQLLLGGERASDAARRAAIFEQVREQLGSLPGVDLVAAAPYEPTSPNFTPSTLQIEGRTFPEDRRPTAELRPVLGRYLDVLGIPLLSGRAVTPAEALDPTSRTVVINETMARRFWPSAEAVGSRLSLGDDGWHTVVGVVPDAHLRGLGGPIGNQVYLPYAARPTRALTFLVHTSLADPGQIAAGARRAVAAVDGSLAVMEVEALPTLVDRSLWQERFFGRLFSAFALAALLLASIGLYGVISYATRLRTREIGVRAAHGARTADIHRLVLGHGLRLVGASMAAGLLLAVVLTRLLASLLHDVSPTDPWVFLAVVVMLSGVAIFAMYIPARRAARVDPVVALGRN